MEFATEDIPVLGVNRASTLHRSNFWVAGDFPLVLEQADRVLGSPTLLTTADCLVELKKRGRTWRGDTTTFEELQNYCPHFAQWSLFSATTALVFAGFLGALTVEVFGADWSGVADFDGTLGGNRSDDRWRLEREIWENLLVPWLHTRGTTVARVSYRSAIHWQT